MVIVDLMNLLVRAWHAGSPSKIHAVKSLLLTTANIIERLSPEYLLFAGDGGYASRTKLYADYKAHRGPKPDGLAEQIALADKALAAIGWPVIRVRDWEADDVIASLVEQLADCSAGVVIASCDKDLLQLASRPGLTVYHPWGGGEYFGAKACRERFGVDPDQIGDYLALVGDSSDGVPGVKGIGPKKAAELLNAHGSLATVLEEARLLRIVGAAGKQLRDQAETAKLSRALVELQSDIPIYSDWQEWPAVEPRAGWVDALRSMDLVACVQRLAEVVPTTGRVRSGSPAIDMEWEHCVIEDFCSVSIEKDCLHGSSLSAGESPGGTDSTGTRQTQAADHGTDAARPGGAIPGAVAAIAASTDGPVHADDGDSGQGLHRIDRARGDDAVRVAHSVNVQNADWWVSYPCLADLPGAVDEEIRLRSIYATSRERHSRWDQRECPLPGEHRQR